MTMRRSGSMTATLAVGCVLLCCLAVIQTAAQTTAPSSSSSDSRGVAQIQKFYEFLRQADNTIFAASVLTTDVSRLVDEATIAMGTQDYINNLPNWLGSAVRMNTVSEMLVVASALQLVATTQLPSVDAAIPSRYLPRGVAFFNPAHPTTALTLRQLMTHTSTLKDDKFAQFLKFTPDPVLDLRSFVEAYFLISSGGTFSVAPDVWSTSRPGIDASYRYARVNVALLAFIIEQVVVERPSLVTSTSKTYMAYAQENILNRVGMSGTWVRGLTGANPTISYPAGADIFGNKAVRDLTSAGTLATSTAIHPAYPADYMYMTTAEDMARLARSLWLDTNGALRTLGTTMMGTTFAVGSTDSSSTAALRGQLRQGQGLFIFDGALMCSIALASNVITKCPLRDTSTIWGHMGVGQHSMVAIFCTDTASTTNPTCTVVTVSFYDSGSSLKSFDAVLGLGAVALQQTIGDRSTTTQTGSSGDDSRLYGLWVFFGVIGIITFVLVASYFTEYLIQPAPLTAGVAMPTAIPGMGNPVDNYYGGK